MRLPLALPLAASALSEDFQVISENRLLASINMRHPEPRPPPSYHTLTSREVSVSVDIYLIMINLDLMREMSILSQT